MIAFRALPLFILTYLATSGFAFALSQQQAFELLRDSGENVSVVGSICEQVARLELMKEYPESRYFITNGIAYGRSKNTEGELDVIVFEKPAMKVALVGEVKCWKNFGGAISEAHKQRTRFLSAMATNDPVRMWATKDNKPFQKSQFTNPLPPFITISSKGATQAGFDRETEMNLADLMQLRQQLMSCQASGQCRAADKH